jgi:tRNA pseudouridine32 synthase/23S rRNA pseudouridine746 synthase
MFVVRPQDRGLYQTLFRDRRVHKTYEAIARDDPLLELPQVVRSRIVKHRGVICALEEPGPPNAETRVERLEHRGGLARFRLTPSTGRTHQLRLHMSGLGVPILGDDFYPELHERPLDDFRRPLQLLAATLEFVDPVDGSRRRFRTRRELQAWTDRTGWLGGVQTLPTVPDGHPDDERVATYCDNWGV